LIIILFFFKLNTVFNIKRTFVNRLFDHIKLALYSFKLNVWTNARDILTFKNNKSPLTTL